MASVFILSVNTSGLSKPELCLRVCFMFESENVLSIPGTLELPADKQLSVGFE